MKFTRHPSRRDLYALGEPFGESATQQRVDGKRTYGGGGGGGSQTATSYTSNVPEYAKGAFMDLVGKADALTNTPYTPYTGDRQAQFTPLQQQAFNNTASLGPSQMTQQAGGIAAAAAQRGFGMQYNPSQVSMTNAPSQVTGGAGPQQVAGPGQGMNVSAQQIGGPNAGAVPGVNVPGNNFQYVRGPQSAMQVGTQSFTQPGAASQFMNPYTQNVVNIQQREAVRADDIARQSRNARAVAAGAFGGSRQAIMEAEAARNLQTQLGDIQAQGLNQAFQQAQQQFNTEQSLGLNAQTANQRAGIDTSQMGLQAALANQRAGMDRTGQQLQAQQANQQAGLSLAQMGQQAQTANQQAALQAALANQQTGYQYSQLGQQAQTANQRAGLDYNQQLIAAQQANQQAGLQYGQQFLDAQRMAEASRQFGANYGLEGLRSGLQAGQLMGQLGGQEFDQYSQAAQLQYGMGAQQQQAVQRLLDQQYGDFQAQRDYPYQQIGFMSDLLRGAGGSTRQVYPGPSSLQTLAGLGTAAAGLKGLGGFKKGGKVKAGLADVSPDVGDYAEGGIVGYETGGELKVPTLDEQREILRKRGLAGTPAATATPAAASAAGKAAKFGKIARLATPAGLVALVPDALNAYTDWTLRSENVLNGKPAAAAANEIKVPDAQPAQPVPQDGTGSSMSARASGAGLPAVAGPLSLAQVQSLQKQAGYDPAGAAREAAALQAPVSAAQRAAAAGDLAQFDADVKERGAYGTEREAKAKAGLAALSGKREEAKNMALFQAGLAILAADPRKGAWGAIGEGASKGLQQFRGDTAELDARKERLDETIAGIADMRRNEQMADKRERRGLTAAVRKAELDAAQQLAAIQVELGIKPKQQAALAAVQTVVASREKAADRQADMAKTGLLASARADGSGGQMRWMVKGSQDYMEEIRKRADLFAKQTGRRMQDISTTPEEYERQLLAAARKSVDEDIARYTGGRAQSGATVSPGATQGWSIQR